MKTPKQTPNKITPDCRKADVCMQVKAFPSALLLARLCLVPTVHLLVVHSARLIFFQAQQHQQPKNNKFVCWQTDRQTDKTSHNNNPCSERRASLQVLPDLHRVLVVGALDLLVEVLVPVVDVVDVRRAVL